ncbi:MAG: N-acetylmuramoyl-L-alanine amidase [Alphaproteobacteria bacterium]|nr:N-acetylmuramoyl-L-alanine amidase [Alphaproteobacteria bacterium]
MPGGTIDRRRFNRLLAALLAGASLSGVHRALAATAAQRKLPLIVLDAGHGGIDPGAIGVIGTYEKNIALPTVLELARRLEATRRFRVQLTRRDDEFIPLAGRVARARAVNADLFLSVHADALPRRTERGASVYTLSEKASDREAALLAASENRADLVAGIKMSRDPEVNGILFDLARRQTNNLSIRFAQDVVGELGRHVTMLTNSHRSAGFAVLKAPDIPSALVEIGCLSNRTEERDLRQPPYRAVVARSLARSIGHYFDTIGA